ncbi:hypothetical protein BJX76DRAFT_353443 [Aspergillus varians]
MPRKGIFQTEYSPTESFGSGNGGDGDGDLPVDQTSLILSPRDALQSACLAETPASSMAQISSGHEGHLDNMLSSDAFELMRDPLMDALFAATDLSFAYATGSTPAIGSDDKQAVLFHCKVFAPLKSTRNWSCSAHTLFFKKVHNRDMAFRFLLAVSHNERAIHYGQGTQPPQKSREHFERGSQLFFRTRNTFAFPDHVSMMLSFLYMYMFWMRQDHLEPRKLEALSRAVLSHTRTYGLDRLCASDDVLSFDEDAGNGVITVSEQVLLARIIVYLYDRDGFCCFFGCGGYFADHMNRISQERQRIWLRSRTPFFLPLSNVGCTNGAESEIDDAATLDVYFELIVLHQEVNFYSHTSATHAMDMRPKLQRRFDAIRKDHVSLLHKVADQTCHSQCTLMAYVTASFFYALQIYLYRARLSPFGTRPIPPDFQDTLNSLISAAYHATKTGPVQLLERFQWSLFMAGLETTDLIHQEWFRTNMSDPAIKKGFDHVQAIKRQSPGSITMHMIRSLTDDGFSVS